MLSLVFSNRYEVLRDALLDRLGEERPGPFGRREVIVPSTALARSVELAVAAREGVAANLDFSFLGLWLWSRMARVVAVGAESPFAPPVLVWRIAAAFADGAWVDAHPRLARYLGSADALMRYELAERVAHQFDQYITYRPAWLADWSRGQRIGGLSDEARADEAWQAELWRRLAAATGAGGAHPAQAFFRALEARGVGALPELPAVAHVFCLPAMPPLYLDILRRLARWMDLRLYVLNPCREYWFEIVDARRLAWLAGRQRDLYHEVGNRLLAAWGRQTQAHIDLLFEGETAPALEETRFVPAAGESLLARLQNAILDLVDLAPGSLPLDDDDRSLEVHVCHSLARELEVLHDRLLALFAAPNPPRPEDVLVVVPDLDAAAPLVDAVFGTAPAERRIPWRVTGLGARRANPVARALDAALALVASRAPASRLAELLQFAQVAQRFGFDTAALARVHDWLAAAGVRWGLDAAQRSRLGLPDQARHSLAEGLERLFLAYARGDAEDAVFAGVLGAGNPEGGDALVLGRLWRFAQTLCALDAASARAHDAEGWRALLLDALDRLVAPDSEWADDLREVRDAITRLHADMAAGAQRTQWPLAVVHAALAARLDDPARGGVPSGEVTFSSFASLRNLPYRVVCVLGLDDGVFPGAERPAEFDLMARAPARGDRQRRADERNLFLDLVLAARERLHISYSGRSARDNSERPPSVLVSELLDYAVAACATDSGDAARAAARARLTVEHPLQAFSARCFTAGGDERVRSFRAEYCDALVARAAAAAAAGERAGQGVGTAPGANVGADGRGDAGEVAGTIGGTCAEAAAGTGLVAGAGDDDTEAPDAQGDGAEADGPPLFTAALAAPPPPWRLVELGRLARFFRQPARFLLEQRLGLRLPRLEEALADDERFLPDWPGRQALAERLLPVALAGGERARLRALALAGGEYPAGALGARLIERELDVLAGYAEGLREALSPAPLPPREARFEFEIEGEPWTLVAAFGDLRPDGLVRHRYDDVRAVDYLDGWIAHLALCAAAPEGVAPSTDWHARDGVHRFRPCSDARAELAALVGLYREGLVAPLPFFPKSAWEWACNGDSLTSARKKWTGGGRPEYGERNDPAYRLAFRGRPDPLDARFVEVASCVLHPLLAALDDPRR